ncbi:2,3-bisphosphoglycerate-independent phosphoglycerate mutase [Candidatus Woesearchaeota archaeon]|nr:2,3-bisphosphoglycerate-independent phosphoglycerate mutase [Candidatus Woesearchaeota archaeon]
MDRLVLLILDGWGISRKKEGNAIALAKTPVLDSLYRQYPHSVLKASGEAVGLPRGIMGNSEVGHLTLGTGRINATDLVRINKAIQNRSFFRNKVLLATVRRAKRQRQKLHLMGLLSDAGVHSNLNHLFALLELAKKENVKEVYVHAFLDGRDTPPQSAEKYLSQLQQKMKQLGIGQLATMMGRFYALDRDNRWGREHKAYNCMVNCKGRKESDPITALHKAYARGETDEFIKPTIFTNKCVVDENDSIIFFNFRSDRARELTRAFVWGKFKGFQREKIIGLHFVSLTQYDSLVKVPVAFPPIALKQTLGEVISQAGISQLRLAETEKWAHVTYFFNGLCECIFPHEKRIHVPSRKVTTYDKTPEMKVKEITAELLRNSGNHQFFVVNFANADMVGHSGNLQKTIKAVEAVDRAVGILVTKFPGKILITADHGNCENMTSEMITSHTCNPVPLLGVRVNRALKDGGLADVAPTILDILKLKKPREMTGKSLLCKSWQ